MSEPAVERLNAALSGRYHIERELGQGGMATVYLADDIKHERKVALKVLKPELAAVVGAERFLAEIKTTANLQHPNILPLFDSGAADTYLFYVMPYVEGETLREKLDRDHQLPVDEAVRIASDVAEALDHAHRQGVIHRDIKPGNILLRDGRPLVADFGIALAVGVAGGGRMTETGLSMGTPHYMSPEQATGDMSVGASTDVYALGCVLYEMLVGEPPYTGSTAQAILGKIIAGKLASATEHRRSVPANVDGTIRKALEKLPADRFAGAQELAKALRDAGFRHGEEVGAGISGGRGQWSRLAQATTASTLALSLALGWALLRPEPPQPASRQALSGEGWFRSAPLGLFGALAPDGSSMILPVGTGPNNVQLGLKMRGSTEVTPIPGTQGGQSPTYSPDGQWIAYRVGSELFKRPLVGGSPLRLAEDVSDALNTALAWLDDGTILYEQLRSAVEPGLAGSGMVQIPEDGGEPTVVFWASQESVGGNGSPIWAHGLPGGQGVLVAVVGGSANQLHAVDLRDLSSKLLLEGATKAWYAPTGHLVYLREDGALFAAPFDVDALEITGGLIPLFDGISMASNRGDIQLAVDGTLLYQGGSIARGTFLVLVDREGREEQLGFERQIYQMPRFSPDGLRLAVAIDDAATGETGDLWVFDLERGSQTRATFGGNNSWPVWTPDGDRLTFADETSALRLVAADGSGRLDTLLPPGELKFPSSWSGDGRVLAYYAIDGSANGDLWALPQGGEPQPVLVTPFNERNPKFSPDGRWLAYTSNRSGRDEIYVRPYPGPGPEVTVSTGGGGEPVWSPDGAELFYRTEDQFMAVAVDLTGPFRAEAPRPLFADHLYWRLDNNANYDIAPDGEHFVMVSVGGSQVQVTLVLVQDWFTELRERMGEN